jgi:stearoyl-CoA desaturase (delta-9 desaturase)
MNFQRSDDSKNHWLFSILLFGEGWHNNHHQDPGRWSTTLRWWEIDLTGIVIKGIKK